MSSVRGGGYRGQGYRGQAPRGSRQSPPMRAGGSTGRGRVYSNNAPRSSVTGRGMFGQPSQQNAGQASRSSNPANVYTSNAESAHPGAFGAAKTRGSWQERYQSLMQARERERASAIQQGQIADPDKPRSLAEAVTPMGTCEDMCAEYERVQRVVQKDVWDEELDPHRSAFATTDKAPDEARMVKKFRRAAAGLEEQLPSDLRPPRVLKTTCDYLFHEVIGNAASLAGVHHFVWDRTRAIRNDFSIQQVSKPDELRMAIDCYERIARFHILSLHQLALPDKPYAAYDWQQEREQLDRTLLSLMHFYDDSRGRIELVNEAEFRSYCVIFQLQDPAPDLEDRVQTWPEHVIQDKRVRKAMEIYMAACNIADAQGPLKPRADHLIARQDWQRFWTLITSKEVSYLTACVAEVYFNMVRRMVLNALFRTFRMNSSLATPDWTVDILCELLAFDNGDEVYTYCERFGFSFKEREDGQQYLDLTSVRGRTLPEPRAGMPKQSKSAIVEDKRFGRALPAVIDGLTVKQAQEAGLLNEEEDDKMQDAMDNKVAEGRVIDDIADENSGFVEDEESLFIPESTTPNEPRTSDSSVLANGFATTSSSIFSRGLPSSSTFGKPSNPSGQPSIFAQHHNQATQATSTSKSATDTPRFDFTNTAPPRLNTNAPSSPLFDPTNNLSSLKKPSDATSNTTSFGQPSVDPSSEKPTKQADANPNRLSFGHHASDANSSFSQAPGAILSTPRFSFTSPIKAISAGAKADSAPDISQSITSPAIAVESRSPSPEPPKTSFASAFDPPTGAAAIPTPNAISPQPDTKQTQTTSPTPLHSPSNNQSASSPVANGLGVKRPSFSTDTKPKKPSPLHNSITAGDEQNTPPIQSSNTKAQHFENESLPQPLVPKETEQFNKPTAAQEFESLVTRLADDLCNDPDVGLFKQYIDYAVRRTVKEVHDQYTVERSIRIADEWRQFTLYYKYFKRWRDLFWQRRLAKTGRERRERRQRRLQQRESQQPENSSLYEGSSFGGTNPSESLIDLRSGTTTDRMRMFSEMHRTTFDGMNTSHESTNRQPAMANNKRPASSHGEDISNNTRELGHKRLKSSSHVDERGRIVKPVPTSHTGSDILSRSAFLSFSAADHAGKHNKNTTMSNYFRHKASGLHKVDRLTGLRGTKRWSETPQVSSQTSPPALRSSSRLERASELSINKALMPSPPSAPSRTPMPNEEDEALFARLKAARDNLKESMSNFQPEAIKDDELHRSMSSQSSTDSPSLIKARAEARLRASGSHSNGGLSGAERSVPAYRLRESKFVPREHYSRAIERAQHVRESRSRESSRPQSRHASHLPDDGLGSPAGDHQGGQPEHTRITERTLQARVLDGSNGVLQSWGGGTERPAGEVKPQPFVYHAQTPVSFADHTTKMSSENPFLQGTAPKSVGSFAPQPTFAFTTQQPPLNDSQDYTIQPSQVDRSLASSFGASTGFGQNSLKPTFEHSFIPSQHDSYLHSQTVSLLSDDQNMATATSYKPSATYDDARVDAASEELLDEPTDDEEDERDAHTYSHEAPGGGPNHEEAESQEWDSEIDGREEYDYTKGEGSYDEDEEDEDLDGFEDEDGRASDADIDEDEIDEEEDEEDYEHDSRAQWPHQENGHTWTAAPPKNAALQDVGSTAEEAIELSD